MLAGMIPIFPEPGVIIPGQLGPTNVAPNSSTRFLTISISRVGTPSVIHIMSSIPDSAASNIESLQNGAGTKISAALGFTSSIASLTVSNTGLSR